MRPGVSGDSWGSQEGCQGPFRPSGRNRGLPLRRRTHSSTRGLSPRAQLERQAEFHSPHRDMASVESVVHWDDLLGQRLCRDGIETRTIIPAPLPLSPFSPPDRDRRGDSPAWSGRCIGEGNGTPLQCSCLENPRDEGEPGRLNPALLSPPPHCRHLKREGWEGLGAGGEGDDRG